MQQYEVLINENEIKKIIQTMGAKITADYNNKDLVVICIMNGAFIFSSDLVRQIDLEFPIYFLRASSYGEKTFSSGNVEVNFKEGSNITGKDVLILEDIVDTGNTVVKVNELVNSFKPKSLEWASFLSKPSRRVVDVKVKYIGQEIEDKFVIGYGLDLAEKYRNIPYVGIYQE